MCWVPSTSSAQFRYRWLNSPLSVTYVLPEILRDGARQFGGAAQHVGSFQVEENDLAPVPDDDSQIWKAVKDSGQYHADDLNSGFVMPANPRARKHRVDVLAEPFVVRVQHTLLW